MTRLLIIVVSLVAAAEARPRIPRRERAVASDVGAIARVEAKLRGPLKYEVFVPVPECTVTSFELAGERGRIWRALHVSCSDVLFETGVATLSDTKEARDVKDGLDRFFATHLCADDKVLVLGSVDRQGFSAETTIPLPDDNVGPSELPRQRNKRDQDDWRRNRTLSLMRAEYVASLVPIRGKHAIGLGETYLAARFLAECARRGKCAEQAIKQPTARRIEIFVLKGAGGAKKQVDCVTTEPLACLEDAAATRIIDTLATRAAKPPSKLACWLGPYDAAVADAGPLVAFALEQLTLHQHREMLCNPNAGEP